MTLLEKGNCHEKIEVYGEQKALALRQAETGTRVSGEGLNLRAKQARCRVSAAHRMERPGLTRVDQLLEYGFCD